MLILVKAMNQCEYCSSSDGSHHGECPQLKMLEGAALRMRDSDVAMFRHQMQQAMDEPIKVPPLFKYDDWLLLAAWAAMILPLVWLIARYLL